MTLARCLREHDARQLVERERLHDAGATALLEEALRRLALYIARKEDDARGVGRIALEELAVDHVATRVRHPQVEQQRVVAPTREESMCFGACARGVDRVTEPREVPHDRGANGRLIIHDEYGDRATG